MNFDWFFIEICLIREISEFYTYIPIKWITLKIRKLEPRYGWANSVLNFHKLSERASVAKWNKTIEIQRKFRQFHLGFLRRNKRSVSDLFRNYTSLPPPHLLYFWWKFLIYFTLDLYHAYRNLDTSSLHDSNNINQNFSSQPYFDFAVARNVTTRVGQTAFLNCRVEQLGDKLVRFLSTFPPPLASGTAIFFNLDELSRLSHTAVEWYFSFTLFSPRFCAGELDP